MEKTALADMADGAFKRQPTLFRETIKAGTRFPPEAGRYHLYVSLACPWASRAVAVLYMKGLEGVIGLSVTHPTWARTRPDDPKDQHAGWQFRAPTDEPVSNLEGFGKYSCEGCVPDTVNNARFVRDLYELVPDCPPETRYTVPVLWDKKLRTIVNNESSEILRMLNSQFDHLSQNPELDLYPKARRSQIDAVNDIVYNAINNGVYKCGFAQAQAPYEQAFRELFDALDWAEQRLTQQRYLVGDVLTEADVRLFVTLIRFDEVYVVYFKTNKRSIREYPNLFNYVKDIYQTPGVAASVNMAHIKTHYFTSHPKLNAYGIIPVGPGDGYSAPHDRGRVYPAELVEVANGAGGLLPHAA